MKYLEKKLSRVQRLACLMISSAFPNTPTEALEMLLNIMPINEFLLSEVVKGSYRLFRVSFWLAKTIISTRKTESHVDVCNEAKENLPLLRERVYFVAHNERHTQKNKHNISQNNEISNRQL